MSFQEEIIQMKLICVLRMLTLLFQGIPTHDAEGKELTKSALKKLTKQYETQEKKYNKLMASHGAKSDGQ